MTRSRSVAVAQSCPVKNDVLTNLTEHIRLVRLAHSAGAQVVLFPELSLTGYEFSDADHLAFEERDPRLSPLLEAARATSTVVIVGAPVRIGPHLHIGAFILQPDGTTAIYTKHRLGAFSESSSCDGIVPPAEVTVFRPGERNPLIHIGRSTAALAICADIGNPSHVAAAAARGADMYLASMFVIPSEFEADAKKLRGYASAHCLLVAFANFGSPTGGLAAAGRSAIWSPGGALIAQLPSDGAGVAVAIERDSGWHGHTVSDGQESVAV